MAENIDELQIEIKVKENKSAQKIDAITLAVNNLTKALSGLNKFSNVLDNLAKMKISDVAKNVKTAIDGKIPSLDKKDIGLNEGNTNIFPRATEKISKDGLSAKLAELKEKVSTVTSQISELNPQMEQLQETATQTGFAFEDMGNEINNAGKDARDSAENAKKSASGWSKLTRAIGRIALYRAIRSALKAITQAFREGFQNFVQFDEGSNKAMSNVTNSVNQLKNTLGVTVGYLVQSLEPVIVSLSDMAVSLFENINMAMASLQGKDTYAKAIKQNDDYAESLKKVNGQLLSFDTFNTLSTSQQETKPEDLYENVEMPEELSQMAETFKTIFELVKKIVEIVGKIIKIIKPLITPVLALLEAVLSIVDALLDYMMPALETIIDFIGALVENFAGGLEFISGIIKILTGDFDGAWKHIANGFATMINGMVNLFISFVNMIIDALNVLLKPISLISKLFGGGAVEIPKITWKMNWQPYASGGSFNTGDYFVANENGQTELIASTNKGGAVMNMEQLQTAIYNGMIMAMADNGDKEITLKVDQTTLGRVVAQSYGFISETNRRNSNLKLV